MFKGVIDSVMLPNQPIKLMRFRGDDDQVVNFGHFSEARKVKSGPQDKVLIDKRLFVYT